MNEESYIKCLQTNSMHKFFGLQSTLSMRNCVVFDDKGRLKTFTSAKDIIDGFFKVRLHLYYARKDFLEEQLKAECKLLTNQARFVQEIIDRKLVISKKAKKDLLEELKLKEYDPNPVMKWKATLKLDECLEESKETKEDGSTNEEKRMNIPDEPESNEVTSMSKDYDYLLSMSLWSLTKERVESIMKLHDSKMREYELYVKTTPEEIWLKDLNTLESELRKLEAKERENEMEAISKSSKSTSRKGQVTSLSKSRSKAANSSTVNTMRSCFKDPTGISLVPQIETTAPSSRVSKSSDGSTSKTSDGAKSTTPTKNPPKKQPTTKLTSTVPKISSFADRINNMKTNSQNQSKKLGDSSFEDSDSEIASNSKASPKLLKQTAAAGKSNIISSKRQLTDDDYGKSDDSRATSDAKKGKKSSPKVESSSKPKPKRKLLDSDSESSGMSNSEILSSTIEEDSIESDDSSE
ncbi:MAG: DNA topoisomerase 2-beta [Marteilia pararefringens]